MAGGAAAEGAAAAQAAAEPSGFSVVLPALDEEKGLPATLAALREALRHSPRPFEIVVVDDASRDGTAGILAASADVVVLRHERTCGYGAALKAGIRAARHPLVVVMDADGTYPAAAVPGLVEGCAAADMVVGARTGSRVQAAPLRGAVKWCFRQFAQWITGQRIPDLNSGLRAFDRAVAERYWALLPDGFSFTTTITVASLVEGLAVRFEPVDYMPRLGRSKVRPLRDTLRIARQLLRLGVRLAPLRTALAFAAPFVFAGFGSAAYHVYVRGELVAADLGWLAVAAAVLGAAAGIEQAVRRRRSLAVGGLAGARGTFRA